MRAGELNNLVTLQEQVTTENEYGEEEITYQDYKDVWADIENLSGDRYFEAQAANSEVTGEITIRYRTDINEKMRVKYNNRIFDIQSFYDPNEEREKIILAVNEQQESG